MESEKRMWGIRTLEDRLCLDQSIIAVTWPAMGDLSKIPPNRDAYKERYIAAYPDEKDGPLPIAGMPYRFVCEVQIGDYVVFPSKFKREINLGIVEGDYSYQPDAPAPVHNVQQPRA